MSGIIQLCERVSASKTPDDLMGSLVAAAEELEFEVANGFLRERRTGPGAHHSFGFVPPSYATMHKDQSKFRRDPVIARTVASAGRPVVWGQDTYTAAGQGDLWEEMAPHGLRRGIAIVMPLAQGRWLAFGAESSISKLQTPASLERQVTGFMLLAAHTAARTEEMFFGARAEAASPLSERQREVLAWTSKGKSAWEVGRILGIAESTVNQHLQAITKLLEVRGKAQAVAVATSSGWI